MTETTPPAGDGDATPATPAATGELNMLPAADDPVLQMLRLGLNWDGADGKGGSTWVSYPQGLRCDIDPAADHVTFTDMDTHLTQQVPKAGLPRITKVTTWRSQRDDKADTQ